MNRPAYGLGKFPKLRFDRARGDPAPHKPLMLLVLGDGVVILTALWAIRYRRADPTFGAQLSECGSLLPLSPPLTGQRSGMRRDESRPAKAASSRRSPRSLWRRAEARATLATDLPLWLHRWDGPHGYPDIG